MASDDPTATPRAGPKPRANPTAITAASRQNRNGEPQKPVTATTPEAIATSRIDADGLRDARRAPAPGTGPVSSARASKVPHRATPTRTSAHATAVAEAVPRTAVTTRAMASAAHRTPAASGAR